MYLKNADLNHDEEQIHRVLGLTDEHRRVVRERIFYTCMRQVFQTAQLFEDPDDAPPSMNTLTGYLKAVLTQMDDELDYEYTLLNFFTYGKMAIGVARKFLEMRKDNISQEEKIKMGIGTLIEKMIRAKEREEEEEEDEPLIDQLNEQNLMKRAKFAEQHSDNFDNYFKALQRWGGSTSDGSFDVDDLLNDLLK